MRNPDENRFAKEQELERYHAERRKRQLEALRLEEQEGIASELSTSEDVAAEALNLGFDRDTARVLPLVPLIEMAWVDGTMSNAESAQIIEVVKRRGIDNEAALEFVAMLLEQRPSALFFQRVHMILKHIVEENPSNAQTSNVLSLAHSVAEAAGGFFGLTDPVSEEERELLGELSEIFTK